MAKRKQNDIDTDPGFTPVEPNPPPKDIPQVVPEKKPVEPKSSDEGEAKVVTKPSAVSLEVFVAASGIKWDQMAGFKLWAKNLKRCTILEWRKRYEQFLARKV